MNKVRAAAAAEAGKILSRRDSDTSRHTKRAIQSQIVNKLLLAKACRADELCRSIEVILIPLMTASRAVYSQLHTLSVIGVGTTAAQLTHFTHESKHKPEEQHLIFIFILHIMWYRPGL